MQRFLLIILISLIVLGCVPKEDIIHGAGATFPLPLYKKMFNEYKKLTAMKITYEGIGSGAGIMKFKDRNTDFCATDMIIDDEQLKNDIVYIPTCIGAVAIVYNLPAKPVLNLTPEILVNIFMGIISRWNDVRIKEMNPNIILPNQRILIINRSDVSGTSQIFNNYLSKVSDKWSSRKKNPLKKFFAFSVTNNEEMAEFISDMSGSIGFLSLSYAAENNMSFAKIQNSSGNFILPSLKSVSAAAEMEIPDDTIIYLTDTKASHGYPISSFTWLIFYKDLGYLKKEKAKKLIKLVDWMIHDGQKFSSSLDYAPLSQETVQKSDVLLKSVTWNNEKIY